MEKPGVQPALKSRSERASAWQARIWRGPNRKHAKERRELAKQRAIDRGAGAPTSSIPNQAKGKGRGKGKMGGRGKGGRRPADAY